MILDFNKCKTKEDVEKVFKKQKLETLKEFRKLKEEVKQNDL